jgi:PQQ-like domain
MRSAISVLGVLAAPLLVGACFDPTRPCGSDADCVNGGTCDPGTKTCVAAGNPNDKTPPVFSIVVTPPPLRQETAKLTEYDPGSPDGGRDAFRRDESVEVTVTSGDHDVDAGSVKLLAHGVAASAGTAVDVPLAPCGSSNPAASNPFCREGTVQLAPLPFEAFRAVLPLEVSGADLSNNVGSADAGVNVTRWKWRYSAGAPIYTTPAIADDGTIVFGTSDGGSGSVYALAADGNERWTPTELGPMKASPVIGTIDGGQQLAYIATSGATGGNLIAIDLDQGTTVTACPNGGGSYFGAFLGTPALVVSGAASFEGVLGIANGSKLVNLRPSASLADDRCISIDTVGTQGFPANVVASGAQSFAAGSDGNVRSFARQSGIWLDNPAWGGGTGSAVVSNRPIQGLALSNRLLGTTRLRGVFELDRGTGSLLGSYPDGGLSSDPGGPVQINGQLVFSDASTQSASVLFVEDNLSQGSRISIPETAASTPLAGAGGKLYLATVSGSLLCRTLGEASWSGLLGPAESFLGSPTIDCAARDAGVPVSSMGGVLYVGSLGGNLFAVVVDSPGLDSSAPWPKYQHDVRNTGNPTTPIQSCP